MKTRMNQRLLRSMSAITTPNTPTNLQQPSTIDAFISTRVNGETLYLRFDNGFAFFTPEPTDVWRLTVNEEFDPELEATTFIFNTNTSTFLQLRGNVGVENTAAAQVFITEFACIEDTYRIRTTGFTYLQLTNFVNDLVVTDTNDIFESTLLIIEPILLG